MNHDSVAVSLVTSVARGRADESVAESRRRIRAEKPGSVELVCVLDAGGRLLGAFPGVHLITQADDVRLLDLMRADFPRIGINADQEQAASLALECGVDALPVVDDEERLLGVISAQALMQVLRREHIEDLHRLSGITRETARARHAIEDPPLRRARHRLPWLCLRAKAATLAQDKSQRSGKGER